MSKPVMRPFSLPISLLCLLAVWATGCSTEPESAISVENARIRELIPGQDMTAGYFDMRNTTNTPVTLVGAQSALARKIELHTTTLDAGVMRMRPLPSLTLAPGESVSFQPGGNHLMLFGVRSLDTRNEIRLILEGGTVLDVHFERIAIGSE